VTFVGTINLTHVGRALHHERLADGEVVGDSMGTQASPAAGDLRHERSAAVETS
jgi:hypothetical protein